jgi:hypothetical protein
VIVYLGIRGSVRYCAESDGRSRMGLRFHSEQHSERVEMVRRYVLWSNPLLGRMSGIDPRLSGQDTSKKSNKGYDDHLKRIIASRNSPMLDSAQPISSFEPRTRQARHEVLERRVIL